MSSSDLYGATELFLNGDGGDLVATVNAELSSPLQAGTVFVSREEDALGSREAAGPAVHLYPRLKLRPAVAPADTYPGIGCALRASAWDVEITDHRETLDLGRGQLRRLALIAQAVRHRYSNVSNLAIAERGGLGKTSLWTLAGVLVGTNTDSIGKLYVRIVNGSGTATVSLYKATGGVGGSLVAQGSGAYGATVTLAAQNASGLSGTVKLGTVTADETDDTHYLNVALQKALPATLAYSSAAVTRVDDTSDAETGLARAFLRLNFVFLEATADNS